MKLVAGDVDVSHLSIGDLDAFLIGAVVDRARDLEAGLGRCCADQFDHSEPIGKRATAPVLRDVAEQPMLNPVPLRRARRVVVDMDDEPDLVGEFLQLQLPQPQTLFRNR